jgi:hypothetical protein
MIADLGGLLKSIQMMSYIINYYFSKKMYFDSIVSHNIENFTNDNKTDEIELTKNINDNIKINTYVSTTKPPESKISLASAPDLNLRKISELKSTLKPPIRPMTSLRFKEIILPIFCFKAHTPSRKKLLLHDRIRKIVYEQLDVNSLISKLNSVDKVLFVLNGNIFNKNFLMCSNPLYVNERGAEGDNINLNDFWVKNYKQLLKMKDK